MTKSEKKSLLITGGLGFIGSHVVQKLKDEYEIVIIDYDTSPASKRISEDLLESGIKIIIGDIACEDTWKKAPSCNYVFHAAAQTAAEYSKIEPLIDFKTNALGTHLVAEYASKNNSGVIYCNTIRVYDPYEVDQRDCVSEEVSTIEKSHIEFPPFALSKLMGERSLHLFARRSQIKAISNRMSGIVGPDKSGSQMHGWLNYIVDCAVNGKEYTIFGKGDQSRDVMHVSDFVNVVVEQLENFEAYSTEDNTYVEDELVENISIYNVGGGKDNELSILKVIDILKENYDLTLNYKLGEFRVREPLHYVTDYSKLERKGWVSKIKDTKEIIGEIVNKFKKG